MTEMLRVLPCRFSRRPVNVLERCEEAGWLPVDFGHRVPHGIVFDNLGKHDCTHHNRGAVGRTGAIVAETGPCTESGECFRRVHGAPMNCGIGKLPALLRVHHRKVLVTVSIVGLADMGDTHYLLSEDASEGFRSGLQ